MGGTKQRASAATRTAARTAAQERLRLDLPHYLPYRISIVASLVKRALADIYKDDPGLTEPEWKVMTLLAHHGPLASGDIGSFVTLDRVAVSRALGRLIERGFVSRRVNPDDQRTYQVDLTRKAATIYDRMAAEALEIERGIVAGLVPGEAEALIATLDKIEQILRRPADQRRVAMIADMDDPPGAPVSRSPRRTGRR